LENKEVKKWVNRNENEIGIFIFINMLPSHLLFLRSGISLRRRTTFVAVYNLHGSIHLDEIGNIAAMLELQSLFLSPRSISCRE
jgi:hypothetical protein